MIGAFVVAEVVLALVWMLFAEVPRNLALVWPNPHVAGAVDKAAGALGFAASVCLAILLAARWLKATQPVRRASAPAAIGALTLLFLGALILQGVFTATQSRFSSGPLWWVSCGAGRSFSQAFGEHGLRALRSATCWSIWAR